MRIPRLAPVGLGLAILAAVGLIAINWPPRWSTDIAGGVRLVYALAAPDGAGVASSQDEALDRPAVIRAVQNRSDRSGTGDVSVRQLGDREIEIIAPTANDWDRRYVESIKRMMSFAGRLEFRIIANRRDHADIISAAETQAESADATIRRDRNVYHAGAASSAQGRQTVGYWALVGKTTIRAEELRDFVLRNPDSGDLVDLDTLPPVRDAKQTVGEYLDEIRGADIEILVATNDGCDVTNADFSSVLCQTDEYLQPCVVFHLKPNGTERLAALTGANLPELDESPAFYRHMGIILDGQLLSLPRLRSQIGASGCISGTFTRDEVEVMAAVLRAQPLPARLSRVPNLEQPVGPDTSVWRAAWGFALVTLCAHLGLWTTMLTRHGPIGLCGCLASILQVSLTIAGICALRIPLSLMGIGAAATASLLHVLGVYWIISRACQLAQDTPSSPATFWRDLMLRFVPLAVTLAVIAWGGIVAFLWGTHQMVSAGTVALLAGVFGLAALVTGVLFPLIYAKGTRNVDSKPIPQ